MEIISRQKAAALGQDRYFTGESCINGHISQRWTKSKKCIECSRDEYRNGRGKLREKGVKTYSGKPCPNGHGTERYVLNNRCIVCHRERKKEQYEPKQIRPRFSVDAKEPIAQVLLEELKRQGMTIEDISEKSGLSVHTLLNLKDKGRTYGARMTTIHHLAHAAGATLLVRLPDGRIVNPSETDTSQERL
jgi:hypothetical protein